MRIIIFSITDTYVRTKLTKFTKFKITMSLEGLAELSAIFQNLIHFSGCWVPDYYPEATIIIITYRACLFHSLFLQSISDIIECILLWNRIKYLKRKPCIDDHVQCYLYILYLILYLLIQTRRLLTNNIIHYI